VEDEHFWLITRIVIKNSKSVSYYESQTYDLTRYHEKDIVLACKLRLSDPHQLLFKFDLQNLMKIIQIRQFTRNVQYDITENSLKLYDAFEPKLGKR